MPRVLAKSADTQKTGRTPIGAEAEYDRYLSVTLPLVARTHFG